MLFSHLNVDPCLTGLNQFSKRQSQMSFCRKFKGNLLIRFEILQKYFLYDNVV